MRIKVEKFGSILTSRQLGKEAYLAFAPNLKDISRQEELELDFGGVTVLSPSWAEEFLSPLLLKYGKERLFFKNTENVSVGTTLDFLKENVGMGFNIIE